MAVVFALDFSFDEGDFFMDGFICSAFVASVKVFSVVLNTSVARTSFSCGERAGPSWSTIDCNASFAAAALPREAFARLFGLLVSLADFVGFRPGFSICDDPRRRDWRDKTVESEHVVVDRTAFLTDSVIEPAGRTVTAIRV